MVKSTIQTAGSIITIAMLVMALGGNYYLTDEQLENAYICSVNEKIIIADYLSSTRKTAYIDYGINGTISKVCRNGFWFDLKQYAIDNDIDLNKVIQESLIKDNEKIYIPITNKNIGIKYICNTKNCRILK